MEGNPEDQFRGRREVRFGSIRGESLNCEAGAHGRWDPGLNRQGSWMPPSDPLVPKRGSRCFLGMSSCSRAVSVPDTLPFAFHAIGSPRGNFMKRMSQREAVGAI